MAQQRTAEEQEYVGIKIEADRLEAQTDKALGFKLGSDKRLSWIPKSMVKDWERLDQKGDDEKTGTIVFAIPRWIFVDKAMDEFQDENYVDLETL